MPWYWIVIIVSVIIGPFQAMNAYNKMLMRRKARERRENAEASRPTAPEGAEAQENRDFGEG